VEHTVVRFAKVCQTQLSVDALGMYGPIMRDEVDEVPALEIRAGDLVTLH